MQVRPGLFENLVACDEARHETPLCAGGRATVDIYFDPADGGFAVAGEPGAVGSNLPSGDERLVFSNDGPDEIDVAWTITGQPGADNAYAMRLTVEGCPSVCEADLPVIGGFGRIQGSNVGAPARQSASCAEALTGAEVAYTVDLGDYAGPVCIDTFGSDYSALVSARLDCAGVRDACGDAVAGGSQLDWIVQAGQAFYLMVDSAEVGATGDFNLDVQPGFCP